VIRLSAVALVVALGAIGPCKGDTTPPQRTATKRPQRTPPGKTGQLLAGDPRPAPPLSEVFASAAWVRVDPPASAEDEPEMVDPPLFSGDDGKFGRRVLAIKRAAFGQHVVREGESGPIAADELPELGIERASHVWLVGSARTCVAMAGNSRAVVLDAFGRELELRHALHGCGAGPYAPLGIVAEGVPIQLGWLPARCDEDERWTAAEAAVARTVDAPSRVGAFVLGDDAVMHVLAGDDALHLAIAAERGAPVVRSVTHIDARAIGVRCAPADDASQ
jgi:hypothetical protein